MNIRNSIGTRVTAYATAVLTVVGLAVTAAVYAPHQQMLQDKELQQLRIASQEQHNRVIDAVARLREDVQFLAGTPPLSGIARARAAGGIDPLDGDSEEVWRRRLDTIFLSFIRHRPDYAQIRLIDVGNGGREVVRIDRVSGNLLVPIKGKDLQRKGSTDYVKAAASLPRNGVYLSDINLNREYDRVVHPHTPTIRAATPVFNVDETPFGTIVINYNLTSLFEGLERARPLGSELYLTTDTGNFLIDTVTDLTFGFDLGRPRRLQDELPGLDLFYTSTDGDDRAFLDFRRRVTHEAREYALEMVKIRFDPSHPDRFLALGIHSPYDFLLANSVDLGHQSAWVAALLTVAGSLLVFVYLRRTLKPLSLIATSTNRVAAGEYTVELPPESNDEIGRLSRSFRSMVEQVEQRNATLEENASRIQEQQSRLLETNRRLELARADVEAKAEQIERNSEYKAEFLARVSHDLRTPLNSMLILSKGLAENKESNLTPEQLQSAQILEISGANLLELLNDFLDFSKIEAGRIEIIFEQTDPRALVEDLGKQVKPLADAKGLAFRMEIDPRVPNTIVTDQRRLRQVLWNFLSNALKFTNSGSVSLTVEHLAPSGSNAAQVALSVVDTGPGIPPERLNSIFSPYERLDRDVRAGRSGTGLGLAIVKELVAGLHGELNVDSRVGEGSRFSVRLPLSLSPAPRQGAPAASAVLSNASAETSSRVLIADDDPTTRLLLKRAFARLNGGVNVDEVDTGASALEAVRRCGYSCVVLDLHLADTTGWDVLHSLADDPPEKMPQILLYTGQDLTAEERAEAERLSADVVHKDGSLDALLNLARHVMGEEAQAGLTTRSGGCKPGGPRAASAERR